MNGYLGEFEAPDGGMDQRMWALYYIGTYGQTEGDHHKAWVLDQVARILLGTPVIAKVARWEDGQKELRVHTGEPSQLYYEWVKDMCDGEDGPNTYSYQCGVAP